MTGRGAQPRHRPSSAPRTRRWIPFWVVQATEIAVAVVFVDVSIHVANSGLLVGAALAFFALAVTAQGPLGIARICNQHLHLVLAMAVAAAVATMPAGSPSCFSIRFATSSRFVFMFVSPFMPRCIAR